jgi:hypothetical protein
MSLVTLAEKKMLPEHQYMDGETVRWIAANNPFADEGDALQPSVSVEDVELLKKFRPLKEWFLVPELANSIHGLRHLLRVGFDSLLLARHAGLGSKSRIDLLTAAVLHDIRRQRDGGDDSHGERAARWFVENRPYR